MRSRRHFVHRVFLAGRRTARSLTRGTLVSYWYYVPRKVRVLMAELERMGFGNRGGKGSHRNYVHETGARITFAGKPGDDAKSYQEREVAKVIRRVEESR